MPASEDEEQSSSIIELLLQELLLAFEEEMVSLKFSTLSSLGWEDWLRVL
jgi:hypothetical protein